MLRKCARVMALGLAAGLPLAAVAFPTHAFALPEMEIAVQPPATRTAPTGPTYQLVTPTPSTGTIVIPQPTPAPGTGSATTPYCIVFPGPNPAQNSGVGLAEQVQNCEGSGTTVITP